MSIYPLGVATTDFTQQVQNESLAKAQSAKTQSHVQKATTEDTTTFSSAPSSVQTLSQTALESSRVRQLKVESLRQAVNSAQYQLDSAKITESLVNADV